MTEDEGFVDDSFIEETAWEYVVLHGGASMLRQLAEVAARAGDDSRATSSKISSANLKQFCAIA